MRTGLIETLGYQSAKASSSRAARLALRLVEDAIADDPDHRVRRHDRPDGVVIDYSAEGLLVAFRRVGNETVELIDVVDLRDLPKWP